MGIHAKPFQQRQIIMYDTLFFHNKAFLHWNLPTELVLVPNKEPCWLSVFHKTTVRSVTTILFHHFWQPRVLWNTWIAYAIYNNIMIERIVTPRLKQYWLFGTSLNNIYWGGVPYRVVYHLMVAQTLLWNWFWYHPAQTREPLCYNK